MKSDCEKTIIPTAITATTKKIVLDFIFFNWGPPNFYPFIAKTSYSNSPNSFAYVTVPSIAGLFSWSLIAIKFSSGTSNGAFIP